LIAFPLIPRIDLSPVPEDLSPVSEELAKILEKWEAGSREKSETIFRFHRTVYDLASEVERRSEGELFYSAPNMVRLTLRPTIINKKNLPSSRLGKRGKPFALVADWANTLVSNGKMLIVADDEMREFECVPIFEGNATGNVDSAVTGRCLCESFELPFLIDIRADDVRRSWNLKLQKSNENHVVISASPRRSGLKDLCRECWIAIDARSWQTTSVKYFEPSGTQETVCTVERQMKPVVPVNCFTPDFLSQGYRQVSPEKRE
jgi:hypothetical protein